jgi:hypothetical protein
MIIDYTKKYIFVGLYFSGSSAISKELIENYGAETIFSKHTTIPYMIKNSSINIKEFQVIAVIRNPIEMAFSVYNKMLTNHQGIYTDSQNFKKNGGWISKKQHKIFRDVFENQISFEEYLKKNFILKKYNNDLSYNSKYITSVIRFEKINEDFISIFTKAGVEVKNDLQKFNVSKKVVKEIKLSPDGINKYFGNFLYYNKLFFSYDYKPNLYSRIIFNVQIKFQLIKRLYSDAKLVKRFNPENYWD